MARAMRLFCVLALSTGRWRCPRGAGAVHGGAGAVTRALAFGLRNGDLEYGKCATLSAPLARARLRGCAVSSHCQTGKCAPGRSAFVWSAQWGLKYMAKANASAAKAGAGALAPVSPASLLTPWPASPRPDVNSEVTVAF